MKQFVRILSFGNVAAIFRERSARCVVVCRDHSLEQAHRVADHLEMEIREMLGNAHVVTHIDPCEVECPGPDECARVKGMISGLHSPERE